MFNLFKKNNKNTKNENHLSLISIAALLIHSAKIDEKGRFVLPQEMRFGLVEEGKCEFAIGLGLGDLVVGMNQIHHREGRGFERRGIKAPVLELVKEICIHAPVFQCLEISVEARPRVVANVVNMDFTPRPSQQRSGRQSRKTRAHDGDGGGFGGVGHGLPWRREV